ncbi:hypothetical protein Poly24_22830 [Rosistilla carotiformis]|uniref:Uncharacterized protein n=1 Tax=Rosistilla carotiformis TaxID=2528017 RepID=A0A518JSQ2_9BACT|nr:hypothetical protein [Rosistilla carotiformis]QDV68573.1 hypothetical protein Poly24_22830 [Rosistilla carotiformis]
MIHTTRSRGSGGLGNASATITTHEAVDAAAAYCLWREPKVRDGDALARAPEGATDP